MKKVIKINTPITSFTKEQLVENDVPMTLKTVLLHYLNVVHLMNMQANEEMSLYFIGRQIGESTDAADAVIILTMQDYTLLKKLADNSKVIQNGQAIPVFNLVVTQQARILLEQAENIKGKDE